VQVELELLAIEEHQASLVLCDRGTIDGVAYWPGAPETFWEEVGSSRAEQHERYAAVIHLQTPPMEHGYNHVNPLRIESAAEAARIDARIFEAWTGHPRRTLVESSGRFTDKVTQALALIRAELPRGSEGDWVP
jgi:hypothetical protein